MRQVLAFWVLGGLTVATMTLAATDQRRPPAVAQPPAMSKGLVAVAEIGGVASAVAADAQYAYMAIGRRLVVLSYSAHAAPTLAGETKPIAFDPRQVVLGSGVVYLVDALLGLHVIDVSNRQRPTYVRTVRCADEAMGMAVAGSYGYLACGQAGLAVIDLSQPREPRLVAELDSPRFARSVAVSGEHVLVAERDAWVSGLWVVNVRNPLQPSDRGFLLTPGGADYVATIGDAAFVLGASGSLWVIDITDPGRPARVGRAELEQGASTIPGYPASGIPVYGLWATSDYLYVAHGERGLRVVDVRYRRRPLAIATLDTPGEARGLAVFGRRPLILVADGVGGLRVIDGENPALPQERYAYDESPGAIRDVASGGDYLCIVSQSGPLTSASGTVAEVADLRQPARPVLGASMELGGAVRSVSAGSSARGPEICAVAQSPAVRYQVDRSGRAQVTYEGGLQLVDVASRPSLRVAAAWHGAYLMNVAFGRNVFYGAWLAGWWPGSNAVAQQAFTTGLVVIDDRRLHALDQLGHLALPGQARWVAADGDTVYVAAGNAGLHIVSVSDPRRPRLLGSLSFGANARSVAVVGNVALLATEGVGLVAVDVSDPAKPQRTASVPLVGGGQKIEVRGGYAIVTDGELGVNLIDVSESRQPRWLDRFVPPLAQVRAVAATMGEEYVYLGVDPGTLLVLQIVDRPFPTPSTTPPTPRPTRTPEPTLTPSPTLDITAEPQPTEEPTASPTATPPPAVYAPWLGRHPTD